MPDDTNILKFHDIYAVYALSLTLRRRIPLQQRWRHS